MPPRNSPPSSVATSVSTPVRRSTSVAPQKTIENSMAMTATRNAQASQNPFGRRAGSLVPEARTSRGPRRRSSPTMTSRPIAGMSPSPHARPSGGGRRPGRPGRRRPRPSPRRWPGRRAAARAARRGARGARSRTRGGCRPEPRPAGAPRVAASAGPIARTMTATASVAIPAPRTETSPNRRSRAAAMTPDRTSPMAIALECRPTSASLRPSCVRRYGATAPTP